MLFGKRSSLVLGVVLAVTLTSCAPTAQRELTKGKHDYLQQRYELSYLHIQKAAKAGDPDAQYALGYMYYYGRGVTQDTGQATYWINQAASHGQPLAIKAQQDLHITQQPSVAPKLKTATMVKKPRLVIGRKPRPKPKMHRAKKIRRVKTRRLPSAHHIIKKYRPKKLAKHTITEQYLLGQSKRSYTVQLLGSYSPVSAKNFIVKNHFVGQAHYYRTMHNRRNWYVVVYGIYPSVKAAASAVHKLPAKIRADHPWIKSIGRVQREISSR